MSTLVPVLLSGGSGTRLWPLSRQSFPKQFARLTGAESLFQASARRLSGPGFAAPVIVTGHDFRFIVTEQLAGMEMMAVDPLRRVVAPRFLAGLLSMPLLAAIFSAVGVLGGWFVGVGLLGVDDGAFWSQMQAKVDLHDDILNGVIKSVVFGIVVTWIAVFEGYDAVPTSEGVGRATTRTVVHSSLAVLGLDFVLTALMFNDI